MMLMVGEAGGTSTSSRDCNMGEQPTNLREFLTKQLEATDQNPYLDAYCDAFSQNPTKLDYTSLVDTIGGVLEESGKISNWVLQKYEVKDAVTAFFGNTGYFRKRRPQTVGGNTPEQVYINLITMPLQEEPDEAPKSKKRSPRTPKISFWHFVPMTDQILTYLEQFVTKVVNLVAEPLPEEEVYHDASNEDSIEDEIVEDEIGEDEIVEGGVVEYTIV